MQKHALSSPFLSFIPAAKPGFDDDGILTEQDVRYWMLNSQEVVDMESAVLENPQDVHLWIKLAYKKLHNPNKWALHYLFWEEDTAEFTWFAELWNSFIMPLAFLFKYGIISENCSFFGA